MGPFMSSVLSQRESVNESRSQCFMPCTSSSLVQAKTLECEKGIHQESFVLGNQREAELVAA
jgi:hypothetical protein